MIRSIAVSAAAAVALAASCERVTPAPISSGPDARPASLREEIRGAFSQVGAKTTDEFTPAAGGPTLILIGEDHASVRAQKEMASVLSALHRVGAVQAVLIEGSNGPIDYKEFADAARKSVSDPAAHWARQLDWGRISGYEHFVLTTSGLEVIGVEDISAKTRFAILQDVRDGETLATTHRDSNRRAVAVVRDAMNAVMKQRPEAARDLEAGVRRLRAAGDRAVASCEALRKAWARAGAIRIGAVGQQQELAELEQKLGPTLESLRRLTETYEANVKTFNAKLTVAKRTAQRVRERGPTAMGVSALLSLNEDQEELGTLKESIEREQRQIESLASNNAQALNRREKLVNQFKMVERQLSELEKRSTPARKQYEAALVAERDAFFAAANAAQKAGRTVGLSFRALDTFYADEMSRLESDASTHDDREELLERDRAMAKNIASFAADHPHTPMVVVVGWKHLPGMAAQLRSRDIGFVGVALPANDAEVEPWEARAWADRRAPGRSRFLDVTDGMKEVTLLANERWKTHELATIRLLGEYRTGGTGAPEKTADNLAFGRRVFTYQGDKRALSIHVSRASLDRNAGVGTYRVSVGPLPGSTDEVYEAFDRKIAGESIKATSDKRTMGIYVYPTSDSYSVLTPTGEVPWDDFLKLPAQPGWKRPDRVIAVVEPDWISEKAGAVTSPAERELREWAKSFAAGGSGGGKPPTKNGSGNTVPENSGPAGGARLPDAAVLSLAAPAAKRSGPRLYHTINFERAQLKLKALDAQNPSRFGDVVFLDSEDLLRLPYTMSTGENAQAMVIIGDNTPAFRKSLELAAKAGKFQNKQLAIVTCGGSYLDSATIREAVLRDGALMVWTPNSQITPEAANTLKRFMQETVESSTARDRAKIDVLIERALENWQKSAPGDPEASAFRNASTWVFRIPEVGPSCREA